MGLLGYPLLKQDLYTSPSPAYPLSRSEKGRVITKPAQKINEFLFPKIKSGFLQKNQSGFPSKIPLKKVTLRLIQKTETNV